MAMISAYVPKLSKPDRPPHVLIPKSTETYHPSPQLIVTRNGVTQTLTISSEVAAELIASGMSYGA